MPQSPIFEQIINRTTLLRKNWSLFHVTQNRNIFFIPHTPAIKVRSAKNRLL